MEKKVLSLDKSSWVFTKLGDLAKDISKRVDNPGESEYDRFVGLGNFVSGDIKIKTWETTENLASSAKAFQAGDILFARRNAYLRRASLVDFDGCCSGDAIVLRENHEKIVPGFLAFLMNSNALWDFANSNAAGTMSKRVKWRDLAEYEFLLPHKDQQAQLAKLLWAMDDVIEKKIKTNEKLQYSYITTIEKELLNRKSDKLYFGDILNVIRGVGYKPTQLLDEYDSNCCVVLRSNNISNGLINFDEIKIVPNTLIKESQYLIDGDFAICMSNGSKELVGKCAEFRTSERNVSIGSFCASLRPKNEEYRQLLRHLVNSESYRVAIKRTLTGSAINNLKPSDIEELFLRVNLSSSESVLKKLDSMTENRLQLDEAVKTSKSLKKSLINQVF